MLLLCGSNAGRCSSLLICLPLMTPCPSCPPGPAPPPAWPVQGHPEFDTEVVQSLAEPRLEKFGEADVERMRASLAALPVAKDAPRLQQLCKAFLKGGAGAPST